MREYISFLAVEMPNNSLSLLSLESVILLCNWFVTYNLGDEANQAASIYFVPRRLRIHIRRRQIDGSILFFTRHTEILNGLTNEMSPGDDLFQSIAGVGEKK